MCLGGGVLLISLLMNFSFCIAGICYALDMESERIPITKILKTQRAKRSNTGWIYLLRCERFTKIGISELKPNARRAACQIGSPFKITMDSQYHLVNYRQVERILHGLFKEKWVRGEWFELTDLDLEWVRKHLESLSAH